MGNEFPVMGSMQADWAAMVGSWWVRNIRRGWLTRFTPLSVRSLTSRGGGGGVQKEQSLLGCRPVAGLGLPLSAASDRLLGRAQAGWWRRRS